MKLDPYENSDQYNNNNVTDNIHNTDSDSTPQHQQRYAQQSTKHRKNGSIIENNTDEK